MYGPLQHYQSMLQLGRASGYGNLSQMAPSPYGVPYPAMQQNPYAIQFPGHAERSVRSVSDIPGLLGRPQAIRTPKPQRRFDVPWPSQRNLTPKRPVGSPYAYARR